MPRSKNPNKYPSSFRPLLLGAYAAKDKEVVLPMPDMGKAHRTRRQLYAFMQAVDDQESNMKMPHAMRESVRMHQILLTVEDNPPRLILQNKNWTPENRAIAELVETLGIETEEDLVERDLAERIIEAAERGDFEEVARLEAASPAEPEEPGYETPEPASQDDIISQLFGPKPA